MEGITHVVIVLMLCLGPGLRIGRKVGVIEMGPHNVTLRGPHCPLRFHFSSHWMMTKLLNSVATAEKPPFLQSQACCHCAEKSPIPIPLSVVIPLFIMISLYLMWTSASLGKCRVSSATFGPSRRLSERMHETIIAILIVGLVSKTSKWVQYCVKERLIQPANQNNVGT